MTQSEFNNKLKEFAKSKIGLKILLPSLQLKHKYEEILWLYYIDELDSSQISEKLHLTRESVNNLLCKARKSMLDVITKQYKILGMDLQEIIKILLDLD